MAAAFGPRNLSDAEAHMSANGMKYTGTFIAQPDGKLKYEGLLPLLMLKQLGVNPAQYSPLATDGPLLRAGKQVNSYFGLPPKVFDVLYDSLATQSTIPSGEPGRTIKVISIPGQWYEEDLGTFDIQALPTAAPSAKISEPCFQAAKTLYDAFLAKLRPLIASTTVDDIHYTHRIHKPSVLLSTVEAKAGPSRVDELIDLIENTNTAIKSATEAVGYTATMFYHEYPRRHGCLACA